MRWLTLLVCVPSIALSQAAKSKPGPLSKRASPTAQSKQAPPASAFEVDPKAAQVSPVLGRGELSNVLRALVPAPRGEFESTAEYAARTNFETGKYYAIAVQTDGGDCARSFSYDADSEAFKSYAYGPEILLEDAPVGKSLAHVLVVRCESHKVRTYTGTNAYGATTEVTEIAGSSTSIVSDSMLDISLGMAALHVPASRTEAPGLKPALRVLAVFSPGRSAVAPGVTSGAETHSATRQAPVDLYIKHTVIWANDVQWWVIDGRDGRVLLKQSVCKPYDEGTSRILRRSCG